jgi:transcriptional regulator with XRE-family HTH domain
MSAREHGTRACYVFGPDGGSDRSRGCRCRPCAGANRAAENERNRQIAYGRWEPYVDAGPAREHLGVLAASGIGWKRAAMLAGVSTSVVSKILYGGPGSRPPARRIRPETEAAILAVSPSPALLAGKAPVDATGTRRRMQALVACGWSQAKLAARLGVLPGNFGDMIYRRPMVTAATARAAEKLYGELWDKPPPESSHREKIAASRARRYAAARGWPPPLAWDDIDDPQASPAEGWQRGAGAEPPRGAELAAEARELEDLGLTRQEVARRLGVAPASLARAMSRHPEAGEAA